MPIIDTDIYVIEYSYHILFTIIILKFNFFNNTVVQMNKGFFVKRLYFSLFLIIQILQVYAKICILPSLMLAIVL